ncbi:ubiquitin carboxyl-terminal hydrolase isozyme L5 [Paramyrothecium foliicola]|nr:ubiquitin carboxyl-terminal hydrolase isozyme L5 [Paramyrothecium foliicola]
MFTEGQHLHCPGPAGDTKALGVPMESNNTIRGSPEPLKTEEHKPEILEPPVRRSARQPKPSALATQNQDQHQQRDQLLPEIKVAQASKENHARRNPKRKAHETTKRFVELPDRPLEEALAQLCPEDIEAWDGWNEMESEPAFFNVILKDLGVQDVKAQEIFSIDQDSLDMLPLVPHYPLSLCSLTYNGRKPVHGLIFLYRYLSENEQDDIEETSGEVWFANQAKTTPNACATVSLLNIMMNADVKLGSRLEDFKTSTRDLCSALRGHRLSTDPFIRAIHNSFTRRMDQLNADLFLEQEADKAASARSKKRPTPQRKKSATRKIAAVEYAFHFVAYVHDDHSVWELDGLKENPYMIGCMPVEGEDWTSVVQPRIQARMLQNQDSQLSFNLIALCQSPLSSYSNSIARAFAMLHHLKEQMSMSSTSAELISQEKDLLDLDETRLSEFGLTSAKVLSQTIPQSLKDRLRNSSENPEETASIFQQFVIEAKAAIGEYRSEMMAIDEEQQRVKGRKKDYGPALHRWVQSLAEKGVLEDVIKTSS